MRGFVTRYDLLMVGLLVFTACQPAEIPLPEAKLPSSEAEAPSTAPTSASASRSPVSRTPSTNEMWDLVTINGQRIGHQVTRVRESLEDGRPVWEWLAQTELSVRRFGQETRQEMELVSRETAEGQVQAFRCTVRGGPSSLQTTGVWQGDGLRLTIEAAGQSEESRLIPVTAPCGGLFAVEQSLLQDPLSPGESRHFRAIVPVLHVVGTVHLQAGDWQSTQLLERTERLLPIESQLTLPGGQTMESILWTNAAGEVQMSQMPALQQVTYRVPREVACASAGQPALDLGDLSLVRVRRSLDRPHESHRIRYRARLPAGDPADVFPSTPQQTVRRLDPHTAEIIVTADGPLIERPTSASTPPRPQDREASPWIQTDDPAVQELARPLIAASSDAPTVALLVERTVHENLTEKNFTTAFATAAEVARSREGDCTEHAVLTAALCRACGIPARVVVGLVYVPSVQAFAFHMWNSVWIRDRWVPLDSTLGRGGTGAAHVMLGDSSLDSGQAFTALLPVIKVLGQLQLEIIDVDQ